jgi:hypothetical protein
MKRMTSALVVVLLFVIADTGQADFTPPADLRPGDRYQLIFVSADTRDAYSHNLADYNQFVSQQAALNPSLPTDVTWSVVASASWQSARDNAPTYNNVPIYNTHGERVANGTTDLWDGTILTPVLYDQYGNQRALSPTWGDTVATGTDPNGNWIVHLCLGIGYTPMLGSYSASDWKWIDTGQFAYAGYSYPFYALSSPITVEVPEPSAFALLGMGAVGLLGFSWRGRTRTTA